MSVRETVDRFYTAFAAKDGATMASLYAPDATFSDPVFPKLDGKGAGAMWRMLTERGGDLAVTHVVDEAEGERAVVRWDAHYTFSATGKKVHNQIVATIRVKDGLIVAHEDVFDFWTWSRQALGASGLFLGWSGYLKNKVRDGAAQQLTRWREKNGA